MSAVRSMNASSLVLAAAAVIAGLYWFRDILTPLALAIFLWLVMDGFADWLGRRLPFLPRKVALPFAILIVLAAMGFIVVFVAEYAANFAAKTANYEARLNAIIVESWAMLPLTGEAPTVGQLFERLNPARFLGDLAQSLQGIAGQSLFVLIYIACLFAAQSSFPAKLDAIFPDAAGRARAEELGGAIRRTMESYLWVQTVTGLMLAAGCWVVFVAVGLDNALFWALITFLASYIPAVGGAAATGLPAIFALVQFPTIWPAAIIIGATQGVQFVVGNIIQPRMTGDSLNISILVVFLSLAVWGALWGLPGLFLAVPLTVMLMIVLAQFPSTRWIAVLLSANGRPDGAEPAAAKADANLANG
jgi:AI-2 transport protein TqsA